MSHRSLARNQDLKGSGRKNRPLLSVARVASRDAPGGRRFRHRHLAQGQDKLSSSRLLRLFARLEKHANLFCVLVKDLVLNPVHQVIDVVRSRKRGRFLYKKIRNILLVYSVQFLSPWFDRLFFSIFRFIYLTTLTYAS